jgi:hypothetical protein
MDLAAHRLVVTVPLDMDRAQVRSTTPETRRNDEGETMKAIGNVPPLGLTAAEARALRDGVDAALDALLIKATTTVVGGSAVERYVVDIVRRWAARREEELFPSAAPARDPTALVCQRDAILDSLLAALSSLVDPGSVLAMKLHDAAVTAVEESVWAARTQGATLARPAMEIEDRCPECLWVKGKRTTADPFCRTCARDAQVVCSCCGYTSSWSGAIWHDADGKTVCEGCWEMPGAGAG